MFKIRKGDKTEHNEIKSVQYGVFITMEDGGWEFRTIDEINQMKSEMDKQMKELIGNAEGKIPDDTR